MLYSRGVAECGLTKLPRFGDALKTVFFNTVEHVTVVDLAE